MSQKVCILILYIIIIQTFIKCRHIYTKSLIKINKKMALTTSASSEISCVLKCQVRQFHKSSYDNDGKCLCYSAEMDKNEERSEGVYRNTIKQLQIKNPCFQFPCKYGICIPSKNKPNDFRCHCEESSWVLLQENACYGSKKDQYKLFLVNETGLVKEFQLKYKSGKARCSSAMSYSNFGCGNKLTPLIVKNKNTVISPPNVKECYQLNGFQSNAQTIKFGKISFEVAKEDVLYLYHCEDYTQVYAYDNDGIVCVDIYAKFCQ